MKRFWMLFVAIFALHNSEEIFFNLPTWVAQRSQIDWLKSLYQQPFAYELFVAVVIGLTVAAAIIGYRVVTQNSIRSKIILGLFCLVMIFNAGTHILQSVYAQSLMPGVVTSVSLVIPVYTYILVKLHSQKEGVKS